MSRRPVNCAVFLAVLGIALLSKSSIADQGDTKRVSVSSSGVQGNDQAYTASISADGRYVAFFSFASTLVPGDRPRGSSNASPSRPPATRATVIRAFPPSAPTADM